MRLEACVASLSAAWPLALAEPWDNVGLIVPSQRHTAKHLLLCIDLTEAVAEEAVARGVDMVVAYHPPLFKPVRSLVGQTPLVALMRKDIAVFAPHTAFDSVRGGANDCLLRATGARRAIRPILANTYAPKPHAKDCGMGRVGTLPKAKALTQFVSELLHELKLDWAQVTLAEKGSASRSVGRIAVGVGQGASFVDAVKKLGVDVFVTGELSHHAILALRAAHIATVCLGHCNSERPALLDMRKTLNTRLPKMQISVSQMDQSPYAMFVCTGGKNIVQLP